jgi:hypothetical protein
MLLFSYLKPPDSSMFEKPAAFSEIDENELFVPEAFSQTLHTLQTLQYSQ